MIIRELFQRPAEEMTISELQLSIVPALGNGALGSVSQNNNLDNY